MRYMRRATEQRPALAGPGQMVLPHTDILRLDFDFNRSGARRHRPFLGDASRLARLVTSSDAANARPRIAANTTSTPGQLALAQGLRVGYVANANTNYFSTPYDANNAITTGDFSIRLRVNFIDSSPLPSSGGYYILSVQDATPTAAGTGWSIYLGGGGPYLIFGYSDGTTRSAVVSTTPAFTGSGWYDILVERYNGAIYAYVNGARVISAAPLTVTLNVPAGAVIRVKGSLYDTGYAYICFYDCIQISRRSFARGASSCPYGPFLLPANSPYDLTGLPNTDPYFANVSALLHFDGANTSTTFTDVIGGTWTANSNAQLATAQFKFGTASLKLVNANNDYVTGPSGSAFTFGTGEYTIECWFRPTTTLNSGSGQRPILAKWGGTSVEWMLDYYAGNLRAIHRDGTTNFIANGSQTLTAGTWYHLAMTRSGTNLRVFIDGTLMGTDATLGSSSMNSGAEPVLIGCKGDGTGSGISLDGYVDDVRITKGVARYTSTFSPDSGAFPDN